MPIAKFIWIAITWALGLGPLSLMAQGLPWQGHPSRRCSLCANVHNNR
jgi:hypothetical protein